MPIWRTNYFFKERYWSRSHAKGTGNIGQTAAERKVDTWVVYLTSKVRSRFANEQCKQYGTIEFYPVAQGCDTR